MNNIGMVIKRLKLKKVEYNLENYKKKQTFSREPVCWIFLKKKIVFIKAIYFT